MADLGAVLARVGEHIRAMVAPAHGVALVLDTIDRDWAARVCFTVGDDVLLAPHVHAK